MDSSTSEEMERELQERVRARDETETSSEEDSSSSGEDLHFTRQGMNATDRIFLNNNFLTSIRIYFS